MKSCYAYVTLMLHYCYKKRCDNLKQCCNYKEKLLNLQQIY